MVGRQDRVAGGQELQTQVIEIERADPQRVADSRVTFDRQTEAIFRDRWSEKEIATLASLLGRFTASLPGDVT